MSDDPGVRARRAQSVEIFDTTLRDGAQFEGISLTVEDKLRVAEQLDWLGVRWIEGGYPQANPKRRGVLPPRRRPTCTWPPPSWWRSGRPAVRRARSTSTPPWPPWSAPRPRRCASSARAGTSTSPRPCRPTSTRAWPWWPSRSSSSSPPAVGCSSTPSTSSTATRPTPATPCRWSSRRPWPAPTAWCCATPTAARCPTRSQRITGEVRAYLSGVDIGIHTQNDSGCAVANSVAAVLGGARHVQGTVNGYGERTGNANLMTVIPDLTLKLGIATLPEGRLERLTAVSRHVAELVNVPPLAGRPFVGRLRLRPQGRACTPRPSAGPAAPPTSTSTRGWSATTPGCWCRTWAAGPACP